jgi:hypothetical protein
MSLALQAPKNCNAFEQELHLHNVPDDINATGYTPDGWLNEYSLMCGYVEDWDANNRWETHIRLWYESEHYHVRRHDHKGNGRIFWHCFDNVEDARKCFVDAVEASNIPFKEG